MSLLVFAVVVTLFCCYMVGLHFYHKDELDTLRRLTSAQEVVVRGQVERIEKQGLEVAELDRKRTRLNSSH